MESQPNFSYLLGYISYLDNGASLALLSSHGDDVLGAVHQDGISLHGLAVGGIPL